MTKGQRTVASLLSVIAVLLGLNVIVKGTAREAVAQDLSRQAPVAREPEYVAMAVMYSIDPHPFLLRMRSDGRIEFRAFSGSFGPPGYFCGGEGLVWRDPDCLPEYCPDCDPATSWEPIEEFQP